MLGGAILAVYGVAMGATNLVPERPSQAPDYFCSWNVQGYFCSYSGAAPTRAAITEANLFGNGAFQNWLGFYPRVRGDLIFVMDDSWDVPLGGDDRAFGLLRLDPTKFPRFRGKPETRLAALARAVKKRGWKGLGGWICAQESPLLPKRPVRAYWEDRLREVSKGGMSYLKVDWGVHDKDVDWRKMLAQLKPVCAPKTVIEAAMTPAALRFAETYRTYDVETVISAPETLSRLATLLGSPEAKGSPTILNCEDEVYIGAGLGCAYGVMRHPLAGALPNGRQDFVFPPTCRDLKHRMDEVVRAVRWHRIAPPFAAGKADYVRSEQALTDRWTMAENESWMDRAPGSVAEATAPAAMARGLPAPKVVCDEAEPPFVVAARYPNGCVSVATIGRALGRSYRTPLADVAVEGGRLDRPIGVFGRFKSLTIAFSASERPKSVFAQDLAAHRAVEITRRVRIDGNRITIPGEVIAEVGLSAASPGDVSDPGLVLIAKKN